MLQSNPCRRKSHSSSGGFESGDASGYNGTEVVARSLKLKSPVIYVSFNYRLNGWFRTIISYTGTMTDNTHLAFGFLGGKEVQAAGLGNFGLHDRELATFSSLDVLTCSSRTVRTPMDLEVHFPLRGKSGTGCDVGAAGLSSRIELEFRLARWGQSAGSISNATNGRLRWSSGRSIPRSCHGMIQ